MLTGGTSCGEQEIRVGLFRKSCVDGWASSSMVCDTTTFGEVFFWPSVNRGRSQNKVKLVKESGARPARLTGTVAGYGIPRVRRRMLGACRSEAEARRLLAEAWRGRAEPRRILRLAGR